MLVQGFQGRLPFRLLQAEQTILEYRIVEIEADLGVVLRHARQPVWSATGRRRHRRPGARSPNPGRAGDPRLPRVAAASVRYRERRSRCGPATRINWMGPVTALSRPSPGRPRPGSRPSAPLSSISLTSSVNSLGQAQASKMRQHQSYPERRHVRDGGLFDQRCGRGSRSAQRTLP